MLVVQLAQLAKRGLLADLPLGTLDELEHRDVETLSSRRASAMPNAAVDLPLPAPVCTASTGALRRARVVSPSSGTRRVV